MVLPPEFYQRNDVVEVSRDLLGKVIVTRLGDEETAAIITETEAYAGIGDRASHAYGGRHTARTDPMFASGGLAYVYLCYGIHHLFNVVAGDAGNPLATLVRAGTVWRGIATVLRRRNKELASRDLLVGPGNLAQGLGITKDMSGTSLSDGPVRIEDHGIKVPAREIIAGPRIGVDYAGEDAALPYRFRVSERSSAYPPQSP